MFLNKERFATVKCFNKNCSQMDKEIQIGVINVESKDLDKILLCPSCGKKVKIINLKRKKHEN